LSLALALTRLVSSLERQQVRFALVGGLAASVRGEPRFTRDVDIAVTAADDAAAEATAFALTSEGFTVLASVEQEAIGRLATVRLRSPEGVVCDLIFATCGIEAEVIDAADIVEALPRVRVPTASVEGLLAMKTLSVTPRRPRDLEDIAAMLRAEPEFDAALLDDLLGLIEQRGYARGQDLKAKWASLRQDLA
jgi:hypothetical protein